MNPDNNPQNPTPTPGAAPQPGVPPQGPVPTPGPAPTPVTPPPAAVPQPTPVDPMAGQTAPTPMPTATVHAPGSRKGLVIAVMVVAVVVIAVLVYMVVSA